VVESLLCKCEALSSKPSPIKRRRMCGFWYAGVDTGTVFNEHCVILRVCVSVCMCVVYTYVLTCICMCTYAHTHRENIRIH
jgi:hypothetical protein